MDIQESQIIFKQYINGKWAQLCVLYQTHKLKHFENLPFIIEERIENFLRKIERGKIFIVRGDKIFTSINPEHGPIRIQYLIL